ncbi:hypothetical protein B0J13DRAFT_562947 [Dactylonectria estremocensis]|uniref:Secreted protein n=1 Tax=Dactylonectria estremocensis TaxID=1079267 RepID=A0A9P9E5U2_9HYPO|nr:hypothetical protein B0J13DRAFT_562947 [Dactylonectria estremocensis]
MRLVPRGLLPAVWWIIGQTFASQTPADFSLPSRSNTSTSYSKYAFEIPTFVSLAAASIAICNEPGPASPEDLAEAGVLRLGDIVDDD